MEVIFYMIGALILVVVIVIIGNAQNKNEIKKQNEQHQNEGWQIIVNNAYIKENENLIKLNNNIFKFNELLKCSISQQTSKDIVHSDKGITKMLDGNINEFCNKLAIDIQTSNLNFPFEQIIISNYSINTTSNKYNLLLNEAKKVESTINAIINKG